jgi:PD-(D/E)XK nuclease superfamily protein
VGSQISASNTDLFLGCQRPFDPEVELDERDSTPEMNYGSAFAETMATYATKSAGAKEALAIAEKWKLGDEDLDRFTGHTIRAWNYLRNWLTGDNPLKRKFKIVRVETPMATHLSEQKGKLVTVTRETKLDLESHHYDLDEGEIGGTPDRTLVSADGKVKIVMDDKTGEDRQGFYANPSGMGQLRTLALQTDATHVAVFHSPRSGGSDSIYLDPMPTKELASHHSALRLAMSRVGDGSLRPGPHCKYCPARGSCPANYGEMVTATAKSVSALTKVNLGSLSETVDRGVFTHTWRNLEKMAKIARDLIKEEVREGALYEEPFGGGTLKLLPKSKREISLKSIREALGEKAGAEEIERLTKIGAVRTIEWEELRAVK